MKIHERIVNQDDLKNEAKELKASTRIVKDNMEYGELRIPKTWKKPPELAELKQDIENAAIEHLKIVAEIDRHLAFYYTAPGIGRPVKSKGRSDAQPKSIRKAAEWRYANLSEPFLDSPNMFKGSPTSGQDVEGTKQSMLVLNHQMKHKINVTDFIDNFIKDLVDTGTGIIRTSWELEELKREIDMDVVEYVEEPRLAPTYARMMELMEEDPATFEATVPPEIAQTIKKSIEEGKILKRVVKGTEKATVVEIVKNQPELEVCSYLDVLPDPTCRGKQEKMKFCGFRFATSIAELKKDPRYSNVDKINVQAANSLGKYTTQYAALDAGVNTEQYIFKDTNRQPIFGIEYWGFVDVDGSGTLTPVVITWVNDVIIRAEENPIPDKKIPFTFVAYLKKRNSIYGEPDGILLEEDQKISGAITRGVVDILAKNANGQRGMPKGALDFNNLQLFKQGKDYEFNPTALMGRDGLTQITKFPEIPQSALAIREMAENSIREMTATGASAPSQNQGGAVSGTPTPGVMGMSQAARRELGILRRISQGVIEVGKKITAMNKEFLEDEELIRITDDQFAPIQRKKLDCRYDLTLSISTAEEDATKAQELAFMLQTSSSTMDQGFLREILADIAELRRMPDKAEKYRKFQPQPDPLQQKKTELEIQELQGKIAELASKTAENNAAAKKHDQEARLAAAKADAINLKYVEDETGVTHAREVAKQGAQAKANMKLETHKKVLENTSKAIDKENDDIDAMLKPATKPIDNLQENLTSAVDSSTNAPAAKEKKTLAQTLDEFDDMDDYNKLMKQ